MTLLSRVFNASPESPTVPLSGAGVSMLFGGETLPSGVKVTETSSLGMAAVFRAVSVISGVAASLPFHAYREVSDGGRVKATGWARALMDTPHPDMTPFELWETVYAHRLLWGNAYLRKRRKAVGTIVELLPIHPGRVQVGRANEFAPKVYLIDGTEVLTDDDILHIPGFGYDGVCGVGVVRMARHTIGLSMAEQQYGERLFGSGSLATGILQTEQRLTEDQAEALHARWKAKRSGLGSAHETMILDSGAKFQQLTIPPDDAQFLESRRFEITEVCRWFGLPPSLMFETDKQTSWGTGLEQQALGWVLYDLNRYLVGVEQRVTMMLKPQAVYAKYTLEGLLRGDSSARAQFYQQMFSLGVLSTNEIRELEERGPVEGGDVRYRPLNMGELGQPDPSTPTPLPVNPV